MKGSDEPALGTISAFALSPNGSHLAVSDNHGLHLLWAADFREVWFAPAEDGLGSVGFSPDGDTIATRSSDNRMIFFSADQGELLRLWDLNSWDERIGSDAIDLAWSPDGNMLVSGRAFNAVVVWDTEKGERLFTIGAGLESDGFTTGPARWSRGAWSPDGTKFAYGLYDEQVHLAKDNRVGVWELKAGKALHILEGHAHWAASLAFSPDGTKLASMSWNEVMIWRTETGERLVTLTNPLGNGRGLAWSPDGMTIASGMHDGTVIIGDAEEGVWLRTLDGLTNMVRNVAFSPDGALLFGASRSEVIVWETETGEQLRVLKSGGKE
jgi:WD40 repeat protein